MTETVAYAKKFSFSVEAKTETLGNDEQYSSSRWSWFTFEACMNTWALALWASPPPCWGELLKGWSRWPTPDTSPSSIILTIIIIHHRQSCLTFSWPVSTKALRVYFWQLSSSPISSPGGGETSHLHQTRLSSTEWDGSNYNQSHCTSNTAILFFFIRQDTVRCWSPSWLKAKFSPMSQIAISWSYRCWSCRSCWQVLIWYRWWRWSHTFVA